MALPPYIKGFASIYSQTLMVGTVLNDRHTLLSLPILGTSRVADPNIEKLFEFIGARHPKIMLGYTNENNQFWGVLRSEDKNQKQTILIFTMSDCYRTAHKSGPLCYNENMISGIINLKKRRG